MARTFLGAVSAFFYGPGAGTGKVWTCDATGNGSWQTPTAGGGGKTFAFFIS
jgi:hypothetical protein